jgi:hypothetical protein
MNDQMFHPLGVEHFHGFEQWDILLYLTPSPETNEDGVLC